jgi:beta-1,4-N-acetylglucosaminyltransferase
MKVLVSVGTTAFDLLVGLMDTILFKGNYDVRFQIGPGIVIPRNFEYFRFSSMFSELVDESDLIITHAGAGNVYSMLERRKKLVVVPNIQRKDQHQLELARFLENQNYAKTLYLNEDVVANIPDHEPEILSILTSAVHSEFNEYRIDKFDGINDILSFFKYPVK